MRRTKRYDVGGKTVVITGGGRGLGLQIAREVAGRGAKVALLARSSEELEAAKNELASRGTEVFIDVCDVRDPLAVARSFQSLTAALGPVDVLVNVAGVIGVGPVGALTLSDYRDAIDTNLFGAIHAVECVRPAMQQRRTGRIVNITSLGGKISIPHMLPYCASKFAIVGYSEGLRTELSQFGVKVVTIVPGLMRTGSPPRATMAGQPAKEYATFALSDSLPLFSLDVKRAAATIVDACERGDIETIVGWQAKVACAFYRLVPETVIAFLSAVNRLLPGPGSGEHRPGFQSESPITRSFLTILGRRATARQREMLDPTSS